MICYKFLSGFRFRVCCYVTSYRFDKHMRDIQASDFKWKGKYPFCFVMLIDAAIYFDLIKTWRYRVFFYRSSATADKTLL